MFFCRKVAPLFVLFPSPLAVYFVLDFTTAGCWLQSTPAFFSRTCELENCYRPKRCVKHCSVIIERITSKPALLFSSAQNLARNHPTAQGQTAQLITLLYLIGSSFFLFFASSVLMATYTSTWYCSHIILYRPSFNLQQQPFWLFSMTRSLFFTLAKVDMSNNSNLKP